MKAIRSPGRPGASVTSAAQYAAYAIGCCLSICACTHTSQAMSESHLSLEEHQEARAEEKTVETVRSGPETITTTVEEYGSPQEAQAEAPAGGLSDVQGVEGRTGVQAGQEKPLQSAASRLPRPAVLLRRTVTVDQRGPVLDVKRADDTSSGSEDLGLDLSAKTATKTKTAASLAGWLYVALGVAAALVVGGTALKLTPWGAVLARKLL